MPSDQSAAAGRHDIPHQSIYMDLISALTISSSSNTPVKFELLLESHPLPPGTHVLVEEDAIGIPRKSLRKAYLTARRVFLDEFEKQTPDSETILAASAVLLIYEPEHLTAANARKRILLGLESTTAADFEKAVRKEFWLLDSLFRSPLNRHTKSPTLWGHRRWLKHRIPKQTPVETTKEITEVIFSAAEIHPRNYYAWDYMRWWIDKYPDLLYNSDKGFQSYLHPKNLTRGHLSSLIQDWCLKHPSDTSGWSFLFRILTSYDSTADIRIGVAKQVFGTAVSLKLRNESLWFFLRSVMASEHMTSDLQQAYFAEVRSIAQSESERPKSRLFAEAVLKWIEDVDRGWHG